MIAPNYMISFSHFHYINNYLNSKQVILANNKSKDAGGNFMPNLIYISREKSSNTHHRFKAGASNVLVCYHLSQIDLFLK